MHEYMKNPFLLGQYNQNLNFEVVLEKSGIKSLCDY